MSKTFEIVYRFSKKAPSLAEGIWGWVSLPYPKAIHCDVKTICHTKTPCHIKIHCHTER